MQRGAQEKGFERRLERGATGEETQEEGECLARGGGFPSPVRWGDTVKSNLLHSPGVKGDLAMKTERKVKGETGSKQGSETVWPIT